MLGRMMLVSADLAAERLVRPFKQALKSFRGNSWSIRRGVIKQRKIRAFRD